MSQSVFRAGEIQPPGMPARAKNELRRLEPLPISQANRVLVHESRRTRLGIDAYPALGQ